MFNNVSHKTLNGLALIIANYSVDQLFLVISDHK